MMLSQQALIDNTLALSFENALISPEYSESYIPTITQVDMIKTEIIVL